MGKEKSAIQKILEEAPSPALMAEQDQTLREAAVRIGKTLNYENAGTVEFLFDPVSGNFYFMEVNARLQVEHPVTELTTGLDLVKLQLHVARGGKLEENPPVTKGHAIEVRLNAEDPANNFSPAPGLIKLFRLPTGPGLRIDTGVRESDTVPSEFDSLIAKIIAHGRDRHEALSRLQRALAETAVIIQGGIPKTRRGRNAARSGGHCLHFRHDRSAQALKIFRWACSVGNKVSDYQLSKKPVPALINLQYQLATKLVFHKIQDALGGQVRWCISGVAPLSPAIGKFFHRGCGAVEPKRNRGNCVRDLTRSTIF